MAQRYVPISREEFTAVMTKAGFTEVRLQGCLEAVFERQVVREPRVGCGCTAPAGGELPKHYPYKVRIYSTIDLRDDASRDCGTDAIRVQLVDMETGKPLAVERKVLRTKSALPNTLERARDLWRWVLDPKHYCPQCKHLLVEREGKFGTFLGCSRYPTCKGTRQP